MGTSTEEIRVLRGQRSEISGGCIYRTDLPKFICALEIVTAPTSGRAILIYDGYSKSFFECLSINTKS